VRPAHAWIAALAVCSLVACGEKVQTIPAGGAKKADGLAWQINDNGYLAPGWKPGDEASWNAQITQRTQGQNDYAPRR
jgi:hypothetical protein